MDEIDAIVIPLDLQRALSINQIAQRNFDNFNASSKNVILSWIASAKRPETRAKRIQETVELAVQNRKRV